MAEGFVRAYRLLKEGKTEEALAIFEALMEKRPQAWWLRMHRALALCDLGRCDEAREEILSCVNERPESAPARIFLAGIEFDAGNYQAALDAAQLAVQFDPANRLAKAYEGLALLAQGNFLESSPLLQGISYLMNEAFQSRLLLWCEQYLAGRQDVRSLEEVIAEEILSSSRSSRSAAAWPSAVRRWLWRISSRLRHPFDRRLAQAAEHEAAGEWFLLRWQPEAAEAEYEAALELKSDNPVAYERLIDARYEMRDYEGVVEASEGLGDRAGDVEVAALKVGAAKFWLGDYDGAIEHLRRAAQSVIEFWPQYYAGLCELMRGNGREARQWFAAATSQINPRVVERRLDEVVKLSVES